MHPMLNIAIRAARRARNILIQAYENPISIQVESAEHAPILTNIDKAAETAIIEVIKKAYPDHTIVAKVAGVLKGKEADIQWIIDPLDGIDNFMRGLPYFSISIALRIQGKTEIAVVFNPITNELFTTEKGKGAQLNEHRIRIHSATRQLNQAMIGIYPASLNATQTLSYAQIVAQLIQEQVAIRDLGCPSLDLCYVAAGRLDLFFALNLKPWQLAAGELILRESGGLLTDLAGNTDYFASGNTVASSPKIMKEFLVKIQSAFPENGLK